MKKSLAPVLTLLAGLGVGAVLFVANNAVGPAKPAPAAVQAASDSPAPVVPSAAAPSAVPSVKVVEKATATWAGDVKGGGATIAIAAKDGVAIAYLCDGDRIEAWLQGTAIDGRLELAGKKGSLTGTFAKGRAKGTVIVGEKTWTFDVGVVKKPSGLYRATANVRNAEVVSGWIVVGRQQTGGMSVDGESRPAPVLDLASGTAVLDGVTLTAEPVS